MSLIDLEIGVAKLQGGRNSQMDRFDVSHHCFDSQDYSLFIIYDGHGDGNFSKHAKENLANLIINDEEFKKGNYEKAFVNGFLQEDHLLKSAFPQIVGGTTATAALFFKDSNTCYIANVGDSTAVLGTRSDIKNRIPEAIPVSIDDKPDDIIEYDRLVNARAKIRKGRLLRQGHSINMTRALGDFDFKAPYTPSGKDWISPIPHVHKIDFIPDDEFLVMASDGLWNVYDDQTVVETITNGLDRGYDVHKLALTLATSAANSSKLSDNVTVMLIFFIR